MSAEPYQSAQDDTREKLERARRGDALAREELVRENIGLVKYLVRRFTDRGMEYDDLFQYGCLGLVKAIDRFDPAYPVRFSTYAVPVILGEIRRCLRDEGPIHVSRTLRERAARIEAYVQDCVQSEQRSPSVAQISEALGMDREDVLLAMNSRKRVRSLEEPVGGEGELRLKDVIGRETMAAVDRRLTLAKLLEELPPADRDLIFRRYFKHHTQVRIAKEMGTSQVQISRMESRILKRMRELAGTDE